MFSLSEINVVYHLPETYSPNFTSALQAFLKTHKAKANLLEVSTVLFIFVNVLWIPSLHLSLRAPLSSRGHQM